MPADNMFPGLALPGCTADQLPINPTSPDKLMSAACTTTTTEAAFKEELAAAISNAPQLPPEWAEKAANELNEKPETVQETISSLRSMVIGTVNSHLHLVHRKLLLLLFINLFIWL
jgi:hypothetical protein